MGSRSLAERSEVGRRVALCATAVGVAVSPLLESAVPPRTVVAHRGASAYAPEHTLAAYRLALEQGADYVEQDLAVTRDGVLVCLHDPTLERTTDVARVFPDRFREDGPVGGRHWFVYDFTLAEVKQLDAGRWFDERFAGERIPTWAEAVELVGDRAGLFPELKTPSLFRDQGLDIERLVVDAVRAHGLDRPSAGDRPRLVLQSFDPESLRAMQRELPGVPRVLLVGSRDRALLSPSGLRDVASFASGVGPDKRLILDRPDVVAAAHALGLTVTPYTFRSADPARFGSVREEMAHYLDELGVDALFTDNPDLFPRE